MAPLSAAATALADAASRPSWELLPLAGRGARTSLRAAGAGSECRRDGGRSPLDRCIVWKSGISWRYCGQRAHHKLKRIPGSYRGASNTVMSRRKWHLFDV